MTDTTKCVYCTVSCQAEDMGLLTLEDVKARVGTDNLERFMHFMRGQTVGSCAATGRLEARYYPWDVDRFSQGIPVID